MNSDEAERRYPDAVVFVMSCLLDKTKIVAGAERERAIANAKVLFPAVINAEREAWLRSDVTRLTEDYWETLRAQNQAQRDQTIRGALR